MTHNSELWNEHCASFQLVVSLNSTQRSCCSFAFMAAILWWTEHVCTFQKSWMPTNDLSSKRFFFMWVCWLILILLFFEKILKKRYKWLFVAPNRIGMKYRKCLWLVCCCLMWICILSEMSNALWPKFFCFYEKDSPYPSESDLLALSNKPFVKMKRKKRCEMCWYELCLEIVIDVPSHMEKTEEMHKSLSISTECQILCRPHSPRSL